MENTFNKGDTVELTSNPHMAASVGATARVKGFNHGYLKIEWITKENGQQNGSYSPHLFKLLNINWGHRIQNERN